MYVCICPTQYTSDAFTYAYAPLCAYAKYRRRRRRRRKVYSKEEEEEEEEEVLLTAYNK